MIWIAVFYFALCLLIYTESQVEIKNVRFNAGQDILPENRISSVSSRYGLDCRLWQQVAVQT